MAPSSDDPIDLMHQYSAHNYHPLPVVVAEAQGVWVTDPDGKKYMDMLAAYSAVNFGHRNADLIAACKAQLDRVTLTSRAFHNDRLGPMCRALAQLCGKDAVLPMNTGAEGVETAIKAARKWGYQCKGVAANSAKIIVCDGNFHGRTITIVSFSTDPDARADFAPFTPGFEVIPFGDADALEAAIDENTVAFLVEPIQGEGGVILPPDGYLRRVRELCTENDVLFIADEIQSGLGRTGKTFACQHEQVEPDMYVLGKALGGGIVPVSAVVANSNILGLFKPGEHGSTFGGNPLGAAVALRVIELLETQKYQKNAAQLGNSLADALRAFGSKQIKEVRARGLWLGIELHVKAGGARRYCEQLMHEGLLCKETHEHTIRLAPPLSITPEEIDWAITRLRNVLA